MPTRKRLTTTQRGYGAAHQRRRRALLPAAIGRQCPLCGLVMHAWQNLDLDHSDPADKLRHLPGDRITHSSCNVRRGNGSAESTVRTSRQW